jgi:circadian clock protein KaiC
MTALTTGDASLDTILGGGVAAGSLIVIGGPPGSGKTILAQQMCFANATTERPAIYYTTWSEPHEKMVRHLSPFSFFDVDALGERVEFVHLADVVDDDAAGLTGAADEILRRSVTSQPSVIVIDSSKALHDVVEPSEFRRAVYDLASKVAYSGAVLILVGEYGAEETRTEPEFAVADGIIQLENESNGPIDRRRLRVLKMRGAEVMSGQHSFRLGNEGFEAFPRLETTLPKHVAAQKGRASFGLPALDAAIGGGIPRGDSTFAIGPSGIGKTLLAMSFIDAGLRNGERCLHLSMQETEVQVAEKAAAAGFDWTSYDDQLTIHHIAPVEVDLDQIGTFVRTELERGDVKRVVVDSLAELEFAARDTDRLPGYVWALGGFVRAAGGTTIFTNEMAALGSGYDLGGFSFIFNNVFFMRYVEIDSSLRRGLSVLKMRQSSHEHGLLEFEIGADGVEFGEPFVGVTGMLGWSALRGIE